MFAVAKRAHLLRYLHQHRRRVSSLMLGVLVIWLALALGECLLFRGAGAGAVDTAPGGMDSHLLETSTMPCATCTMGSDARSLDDMAAVPAAPKPLPILALLVAAVLLVAAPLKAVPIPPQPLLPKRPRTLKFYALRI